MAVAYRQASNPQPVEVVGLTHFPRLTEAVCPRRSSRMSRCGAISVGRQPFGHKIGRLAETVRTLTNITGKLPECIQPSALKITSHYQPFGPKTFGRPGRTSRDDIISHSHVGDVGHIKCYTQHPRSSIIKPWSQIRTCFSPHFRYLLNFPSVPCHLFSRTLSFRLVSYNLRYDPKPDGITVKQSLATLQDPTQEPLYLGLAGGEQPWSSRRIRIAQDLLSEGVVLAGARRLTRLSVGITQLPS